MLVLVWMLGCAKPCEYVARCDGEVLQTCSLGVDQLFGSGESEVACPTTVNPHCVELEVDHAFCARTEEPSCTADEAFCDGDEAGLRCSVNHSRP